jgi:hypothetical protein
MRFIILVALSTSSMIVSNGNIPVNNVYATYSDDERQSRIHAHGTDSIPMNMHADIQSYK